jgi:hypothetical protein
MNAYDFVKLVRRMRSAQKAYFKARMQNNLILSKQLEKEVDQALDEGIGVWVVKPDMSDVPPGLLTETSDETH